MIPILRPWSSCERLFLRLNANMNDITRLLNLIDEGDARAADELLPLVYDELRQLAARKLARETPGQTLQATALVHEAYIRLVVDSKGHDWNGRYHFLSAAAQAMRRILVEQARRKGRIRHGGQRRRVGLEEACPVVESPDADLVALDEALTRLAERDAIKAKLVQLRFFGGLTMAEAATALGLSLATAERYWVFARTWLYAELAEDGPPDAEKNPRSP